MTAPKNPKPYGLPISIPASQALANLQVSEQMDAQRAARRTGTKIVMSALQPAESGPFGRTADRQPNKAERDAAAVHDSYMVGDTTPSKVNLAVRDMPGPMRLEVTAIDCYDHNPRIFANEKAEDIEASIRANGYTDALVVTRRREGDRFMLAAGSNTTLRVLQDLWQTTQEERFRWVNCIFQPYESDAKLLAQHLGENLNRGDMRFWEIAKGMVALLDSIESDLRARTPGTKAMGLREQAEALNSRGLKAGKSEVALWRFAVENLAGLGSALPELTFRGVRDHLQPRTNALKALATKFKIEEASFWDSIVFPALETYGVSRSQQEETDKPFDAADLCDQIEAAFAENVGESMASVRQMLSMLKLSPLLTLSDLRMPSPNLVVGRTPSRDSAPALSGEAAGNSPESSTVQTHLPLGPSQVRGLGVNPPAPRPAPSPAPLATGTTQVPQIQPQPSAAGGLFADGQDALQALHAEVQKLLAIAGLEDTLLWHDDMPLGFFLELPDRTRHARQQVGIGSPEHEARTIKSAVWWSLVLMTGQYRNGAEPYIDKTSNYFRAFAAEGAENPLTGTDIEATEPALDDMLNHRLKPGRMAVAMRQLRVVEEAATAMFAQAPERWRRMLEVTRTDGIR
jgi:ParB family protein of integrating conjugative element (PFGI_1 class)